MTSKQKILFVDDDKFLLELYSSKASASGFDVATLTNANGNFIEKILEIKPDLIVSDVLMPGIDGFQAVNLLKADTRTNKLPVIFVTNLGQPEEIRKGINTGAVDYLVSAAFTPVQLMAICKDYLKNPEKYKKRYTDFLNVAEKNTATSALPAGNKSSEKPGESLGPETWLPLAGVASIVGGFGLFCYQIYLWLRWGDWASYSLLSPLSYFEYLQPWVYYPSEWVGINKILEKTPLSLFLIILGIILLTMEPTYRQKR